MKLSYEFSRQEIRLHNITHFQSLFGLDRIRAALTQDRTLGLNMLGSMRIFFELNDDCLQPFEDPDIRILCQKLVDESPALFLATTSDRTMSLLFYSTLMDFTAVSFEEAPDHIRFDCDKREATKQLERFQQRILEIAKNLGVTREYWNPHCARMRMLFK